MGDYPKKRKSYPSVAQKTRLVSILKADPELRGGKFSASFTIKESTARWTKIGEELNSIPGAKKSWKEWRKTWQDMKTKVKRKDAEVRRSSSLTGGGCPPQPLSTEEKQRLNIINSTTPATISSYVATPTLESIDIDDCKTTNIQDPLQFIAIEVDNVEPSKSSEDHRKPVNKNRHYRNLDLSVALTKALNEKNKIKKEYYKDSVKEMSRQTDAMNRQADALNRQADALSRQADALELIAKSKHK